MTVAVPTTTLHPSMLPSLTLKLDMGQTPAELAEFQQQRGTRRRCLNFEVPRVPKMNLHSDSTPHTSISCPSNEEYSSGDSQPVPLMVGNLSPCMLPGIGLHLNTLATTSKDKLLSQGTIVSGRSLISMPSSTGPVSSSNGQEHQNKSLSIQKDPNLVGMKFRTLRLCKMMSQKHLNLIMAKTASK
ncbi:hypothetical protein J5N97_010749 [Dioscorea zingiberensis]|uniref:Uncharacterized protein n=1 Tax=Dioscorea zingiberensis TaxID=325984 RepID=A0A9D5D0S4_9LILI|nr:hypothetical protein J5N97_010749 [Dioscorea zingiberensis]